MRVFFALWPSHRVRKQLSVLAGMCANLAQGRRTHPDSIHLTLSFLGEVAPHDLPLLIDAASEVNCPPIDLVFNRVGFWRHNKIVWCSSVEPLVELENLVAQLNERLLARGVQLPERGRRFFPHITLARKGVVSTGLPMSLPAGSCIHWRSDRFVLVRSVLAENRYEVVAEFPLRGGSLPVNAKKGE